MSRMSESLQSTWRVMKTVIIAAAMNTATATAERGDSRAKPHMPWPDVQPPPDRRADAHQQAGDDECPHSDNRRSDMTIAGQSAQKNRRCNQPGDKCKPPRTIRRRLGRQYTADNPTDAGNAARQRHQQHRRQTDEHAADRGGNVRMHRHPS
jgi:hypothetical protein